jgi:acetyl esterase/lipase
VAGIALLVLAVLSADHTAVALLGPRRPDRLAYLWWVQSLVTGELALLHVVWQAVLAGGLVALGALDGDVGRAGGALLVVSWIGLVVVQGKQVRAGRVLDRALEESTDPPPADLPPRSGRVRVRSLLRPLTPDRRGIEARLDVAYGEHPRQQLDVLRSVRQPPGAPVLVHVHGGTWVGGRRARQSQTLRYEFARRGWVSIAAGYRVSPDATFPDHLVDVKRVVAWVRDHADELGADPTRLVVSGVSAGAHLAALAALTPNDPALQPGFERADTSVLGCISTSGIYDFLDRHGDHPGSQRIPFLARLVMKSDPVDDRAAWDAASPVTRVRRDAPPFFVVHGHDDALAWREEAQRFVALLRGVSQSAVAYAELPGAQHAFETFCSVRTAHAAFAAVRFAEWLLAAAGSGGQRVAARARG